MYQKTNLFSQEQKNKLPIHYIRKKNILVPTEEIVINFSYILRILINYGILRGTIIEENLTHSWTSRIGVERNIHYRSRDEHIG